MESYSKKHRLPKGRCLFPVVAEPLSHTRMRLILGHNNYAKAGSTIDPIPQWLWHSETTEYYSHLDESILRDFLTNLVERGEMPQQEEKQGEEE